MEIHFVLANGMFKIKIDIDRHGPRPMPNNCKNFNPPNFSLLSTFNDTHMVRENMQNIPSLGENPGTNKAALVKDRQNQ